MSCPARANQEHSFVPTGPSDCRSPCPALNALANHGYLPHNGRHITVPQLVKAMNDVYHVTIPLGTILSVYAAWKCGSGYSLALEDLSSHNKIEHDASLTHSDARPEADYAEWKPDPELVQQMLSMPPDSDYLELNDLIAYRARRNATLLKPLSGLHKVITYGEIALTKELFADAEGRMSKEFLRQWFAEERLPRGWTGPREPLGLVNTTVNNNHIREEVERLEGKKRQ